MNDKLRAAILAFVQSIFPVLQLAEIVSFDGDEVAAIMLLVSTGLTLLALVFKNGQEQG